MATRQDRPARSGAARGRQVPQKRPFPLVPAVIGGIVAVIVVVGALYAFNGSRGGPVDAVAPGGPVPTMPSRQHVQDGTTVPYTTNPPTSGDHSANAATWGIYNSTPPTDERVMHNLEHGGVVISYNPAKVDQSTIDKLKTLTRDLRRSKPCLILTPRANMPDNKAIALTSWGFLATLDSYNEGAIRAFWRDHAASGPEFPKGQCG